MSDIIIDLRKRFVKDQSIPINIFTEPYFMDRLNLLNNGSVNIYDEFIWEVTDRFGNNSEEYFAYRNEVKDKAIDFIKASEAYKCLNTEDFNKFGTVSNYPKSDVYKMPNIGRRFISIDMKSANFTSLVHYGLTNNHKFFTAKSGAYNYDDFISMFTNMKHLKNSKYLRQVIFGNCNPKRQVTYERFLMEKLLNALIVANFLDDGKKPDGLIYSFSTDEIVIYDYDKSDHRYEELEKFIKDWSKKEFPVSMKSYLLGKVLETQAFVKLYGTGETLGHPYDYDIKCMNAEEMPIVMRAILGQKPMEDDLVFWHEGRLAKFLEEREAKLTFKQPEKEG